MRKWLLGLTLIISASILFGLCLIANTISYNDISILGITLSIIFYIIGIIQFSYKSKEEISNELELKAYRNSYKDAESNQYNKNKD